MDQEETLDFKALMAKFQDEEILLKQPRLKPALPEKPKVIPPPHSSPHYVPAGARPSLLTSINQTVEIKTAAAPRVVFKDEKKDSKKALIQIKAKAKDKSEGKPKGGKDKLRKGSKEKINSDLSDQKKKTGLAKLPLALSKEKSGELVSATPPPQVPPTKKKGLLTLRKSSKKLPKEAPDDPILDLPSADVLGPAPLIPTPPDFGEAEPKLESYPPKALLPNICASPDSAVEMTPPSTIPASPDFTPPPAFIPDIPAPQLPAAESETLLEMETPALPVYTPASPNESITSPPSPVPTPPPRRAYPSISSLPPTASSSTPSPSPPPSELEVAGVEAESAAAVPDTPSMPSSPDRSLSPLSALERAADMSPAKRASPADQRILNALEKSRRKVATSSTSFSVTPPPEEHSPTYSLPELPPIDYVDRAKRAALPAPGQVNGIEHRRASLALEGIAEEGSEVITERPRAPTPPPKKILPDPECLGPAPKKPTRPASVNLCDLIHAPPPVPLQDAVAEIPAPAEFSETDTADIPEFDEVASEANSPELPASEWGNGEFTSPDSPDGQHHCNGITGAGAEIQGAAASGDEYQENPPASPPNSASPSPQQAMSGPQTGSDVYDTTDNVYEDLTASAAKKKGKTDGGKKRKGPPKNPYAETPQETNEEKSKTGRFGKLDKRASVEGPDDKELKKREKQRLEKEKRELKERQERERKEQKEREKKENEMRKKFKITGHEEAMYQAKVTVTTKGRKNDLPVKDGDIISIIRTTNCPKGKWLAKDGGNNFGYVAVDHVQLDFKEMLELGKRAAITRMSSSSSNLIDGEVNSTGSRSSNHGPLTESFTDDSEEWACDDDDIITSPTYGADPRSPLGHSRTLSMPDMGNKDVIINHQHSQSAISADGYGFQAKHEALQKLATFFHSPKTERSTKAETSPALVKEEADDSLEATSTQEADFDHPGMLILPPPDLYADLIAE